MSKWHSSVHVSYEEEDTCVLREVSVCQSGIHIRPLSRTHFYSTTLPLIMFADVELFNTYVG
jgi:hypothetical protein